jgi:hypothetical protein
MTTSKALSGLTPSRIAGAAANSTGTNEYPIASAYASNIFTGDIVKVVNGYVQVITSSQDFARGVFLGCRYVANGEPKWSRYWPANTSATDIFAQVMDNVNATYLIQADASMSIGDINSQNFGVTLGAGSAVTGISGFGINAGTRTTGAAMFRPVAVWQVDGNDINVAAERAFPIVEVRIAQNADHFIAVLSSVGAVTSATI